MTMESPKARIHMTGFGASVIRIKTGNLMNPTIPKITSAVGQYCQVLTINGLLKVVQKQKITYANVDLVILQQVCISLKTYR